MSLDVFDVDPSERADTANLEQFRGMSRRRLEILAGMLSIGMGKGIMLSQEAALWYMDAQTALAEQAQQPPKPPRGKTIRIGRAALGNT